MTVSSPSHHNLAFTSPPLQFGDNAIAQLPALLDSHGITAPLLVTDSGVEAAGILDDVTQSLAGEHHTYYAATEPATDDFTDVPTNGFDGVIAVGGGSCLDTAKVAALLSAYGGHPADYLGVDRIPGPVPPVVAIPTTSGTGSQATQTAVLSHDGVKRGISDEQLRPAAALVDPRLTFDLPRDVTARAGLDAFVHALESLTARDYRWVEPRPINYQGANPVSRPLSRRALRLVYDGLEPAVFDGSNQAARRSVSLGAHLAGVAFSNAGLGIVHALASTLGGMTGRSHGACLAASLQPGLRYNLPVRRESYATIARDLGLSDSQNPEIAAGALLDECARLTTAIGLPGSLRDLEITPADIDEVYEKTRGQDRRLTTNPREVTDDFRAVLDAAIDPVPEHPD